MLWTSACGQCFTLPACVQIPCSTQKPTKNTQYQKVLGRKEVKELSSDTSAFLSWISAADQLSKCQPLLSKPKHHNWSNFKTYLQYQWSHFRIFGLAPIYSTFLSFICWYDSAGKSESSIFSKGLSPVSVKFVPWTLDVGSEMVQYNCWQFPKERQTLD